LRFVEILPVTYEPFRRSWWFKSTRNSERLPLSQEDASKNRVLWKIAADPKSGDSTLVETIDKIEYGKVPTGFV
jgi:uncharacterized protein with ParB-like and HNH nuclease domain